MISTLIAAFLLTLLGGAAHADCTVGQGSNPEADGIGENQCIGQSFVACETGLLYQIDWLTPLVVGDRVLQMQPGTGTLNPTYTTPIFSNLGGVTLSVPFPVVADSVYSFSICLAPGVVNFMQYRYTSNSASQSHCQLKYRTALPRWFATQRL